MRLKETEKSELERITLNKSEALLGTNGMTSDPQKKSKTLWSA